MLFARHQLYAEHGGEEDGEAACGNAGLQGSRPRRALEETPHSVPTPETRVSQSVRSII